MRLVTFSQLVWLLVGLFFLSLYSVVLLDLRFFMSHAGGLVTSVDGGSGSEMISQEPEINSEEEEGERIFNNFAENRNLSLRKDRQRVAPGMWLTSAIINEKRQSREINFHQNKNIKCWCCNLVCHGFTLVINGR
jgi:hypothetical protein